MRNARKSENNRGVVLSKGMVKKQERTSRLLSPDALEVCSKTHISQPLPHTTDKYQPQMQATAPNVEERDMEVVDANALDAEEGGGEGAPSSSSSAAPAAQTCSTNNTSSSRCGSDDIDAPNFGTFLIVTLGVSSKESMLTLPLCLLSFFVRLPLFLFCARALPFHKPASHSPPLGYFLPGLRALFLYLFLPINPVAHLPLCTPNPFNPTLFRPRSLRGQVRWPHQGPSPTLYCAPLQGSGAGRVPPCLGYPERAGIDECGAVPGGGGFGCWPFRSCVSAGLCMGGWA